MQRGYTPQNDLISSYISHAFVLWDLRNTPQLSALLTLPQRPIADLQPLFRGANVCRNKIEKPTALNF